MRKGNVFNMQESIVNKSTHQGILRRILVALVALAAVLTLGACRATGGGQIDAPVPSGVLPPGGIPFEPVDGTFTGEANFGFNFTCEMTDKNKAVIKGEITYHDTGTTSLNDVVISPVGSPIVTKDLEFDPIRIHGVVDPLVFTAADCETAAQMMLGAAQFDGTYRSQDTSLLSAPSGRFTVLTFDQGEPGRTNDPAFVTGDGFSIELFGGPYAFYTRSGYIEGGNIQVDDT
jgi:hypothetical protein